MSTRKRKRTDIGEEINSLQQQLEQQLTDSLEGGETVVLVTGAGISVSSGIPPYRGASNAVWEKTVEEWGTKKKFIEDPLTWYNTFWLPKFTTKKVKNAKPNISHQSITNLQKKYKNLYVITQNMDNLHNKSGSPSEQLIEIHGRLGLYRCISEKCINSKENYFTLTDKEIEELSSKITGKNKNHSLKWNKLPTCKICNDIAMPLTLMFDEKYKIHSFFEIKKAKKWLKKSKLMLFIGTSHTVNITRIAENIGYINSIPLYNINLRDSINGMINIHIKAENLLHLLSKNILKESNNGSRNYLSQSLDCFSKKQKLNHNQSFEWIKIQKNDEKIELKKNNLIQQLFYNRPISLFSFHENYCFSGEIYKFCSCNNVKSIVSIAPSGIGCISGFILNENLNDDFYSFFNDKIKPDNSNFIWLSLDSYIEPLDEKIKLRSISRITQVSSIPRLFYSFLKRKQHECNEMKIHKNSNSSSDESICLSSSAPVVPFNNSLQIEFYVGFYFNEDKFNQFDFSKLGISVVNDNLSFSSNLKASLQLIEANDEIWNIYSNFTHPWIGKHFPTFLNFKNLGGIAFFITMLGKDNETIIISACTSSFVADDSHQIDVFTNPQWTRKGLGTVCAFAFLKKCLSSNQIPNWTCSTTSIGALRIAQKLGFVPVSIIPALYREFV